MKRKTNLFYTTGPDSKFITFSNYTEALTGNYLSVNTKLFPDNFLCLNIKGLNSTTKTLFIKYLVRYYENKLAVLRDHNINNNETIESHIYPLAYLLEAILKVVYYDGEEYVLNINNNELVVNDDIFNNDNSSSSLEITNLITYIGQISEEDYYGTYTDIICNINCENYVEGIITLDHNDISYNEKTVTINDNPNVLYGWENDYLLSEYSINDKPIYDVNDNTYVYNSNISSLIFNKLDSNSQNDKTLKFNIIIPLFSKINIDLETSTSDDSYDSRFQTNENLKEYLVLNGNENGNENNGNNNINNINKHIYDVPLGMWIYADNEEDTFIKLIKDKNLNLYPNWSLLISSQFKPFPYSTDYKKQNATANNTESNSIGNSFSTFAEVLSRMNDVLDRFNEINISLASLNNRIESIEKKFNSLGTTENIQKIDEKVVQIESSVNNQINAFKQYMHEYLENIKWKEA